MFVALGIQAAMPMRRVILSFVACLSPPCFSTLSHKGQDFRVKGKKNKVKVTLVQAVRLCTGRTAHRGSRGIALL